MEDDQGPRKEDALHDFACDLEDEFERLRIWAKNIGVFAKDKTSLDHRLREAKSVKTMVLKLLRALAADLDRCEIISYSETCTASQMLFNLW